MHFYETFLAEYDPKLRKSRGVYYTPEPVVDFIVRAVDDILKSEFGLPQGLADTSKTKIKLKTQIRDERTTSGWREEEKEVHKVQILDPATGTGTFLAQVIKQIHKSFERQQGIWSNYVDEHLVPRLNGFELLMAPYAMAHLKLDLLLNETGYKSSPPYEGGVAAALGGRGGSLSSQQRFRIYLTNALEEYHPETGTLWATWLSNEANEANHIKRDTPVMVVLGNPPYSGESSNKGKWIMSLMEDYKKEPGGKEKLKERNPKWINDDYVKFLRYGQHFIEKNGEGVLAFINNHGFLDNPTFRGMRWQLLKTYDTIYVVDLHGNSKKKEVAPDGSPDVNVFDIQPGVSINILIKTGEKAPNEMAKVFHHDIYGSRENKYNFLVNNDLATVPLSEIDAKPPMHFFTSKEFDVQDEYDSGFRVNDLFELNGVGMTTAHDEFVIREDKNELLRFFQAFQSSERDEEVLHGKFGVRKKNGWNILHGFDNIRNEKDLAKYIRPVTYRPFDTRYIFYEDKLVWRTVRKVMQHFLSDENIGLVIGRQGQVVGSMPWNLIFATTNITDFNMYYRGGGMLFPLYLYPDDNAQQTIDGGAERTPNLNMEIVKQIAERIGLGFTAEKLEGGEVKPATDSQEGGFTPALRSAESGGEPPFPTVSNDVDDAARNTFAPIDLLDYIYAVLHSPTYRAKYKEFLKIDFPRVPYPKDADTFWQLVKLGGEIRQIHLLESPKVNQFITGYPVDGGNQVMKIEYRSEPGAVATGFRAADAEKNPVATAPGSDKTGRVFINQTQHSVAFHRQRGIST